MTSASLETFAAAIPDDLLPEFFPGGRSPEVFAGRLDRRLAKFVLCYTDVAFGWKLANVFARHRIPLPPLPDAEDEPILQAYLYCLNPKLASPEFLHALSLTHSLRQTASQTVRALLIPRTSNASEVGRILRLNPEAVNIFEKLFFNVIDRRDDVLFIRDVVYPNTRIADMLRDQYQVCEVGDILMRAGYDNGYDDVIHLAGLSDNPNQMMATASELSRNFEGLLMANATVMARNGWLNHTRQTPTLGHARQLIAAGKIGGADAAANSDPFSAAGQRIMDDMVATRLAGVRRDEARRMDRLLQAEHAAG